MTPKERYAARVGVLLDGLDRKIADDQCQQQTSARLAPATIVLIMAVLVFLWLGVVEMLHRHDTAQGQAEAAVRTEP